MVHKTPLLLPIARLVSIGLYLFSELSVARVPPIVKDFGSAGVNGTGTAFTITFSLSGVTATPTLSIGGIDFTSAPLSCDTGNTVCSSIVTFLPRSAGLRQDSLVLKDPTGNRLASAFLHGIGIGPSIQIFPAAISTLAGNGTPGYTDGPPASASFRNPQGLAADAQGNLYVADSLNQVVRKIAAGTGIVSTVAGNGIPGYSGDGGPALSASMYAPSGLAVDAAGNIFIADQGNSLIRSVDAISGIITTVAGGGNSAADGVAATAAMLNGPTDIAVDASGNLYITDSYDNLIRKVTPASGIIATIAGGGTSAGFDGIGDGVEATSATLSNPTGITLDGAGNLYFVDTGHLIVRRVDASTGLITVIAGNGVQGNLGNGGLAINAELSLPSSVRLDAAGNLYIADFGAHQVRFVNAQSGLISLIAGNGSPAYTGDGGVGVSASLDNPSDLLLDAAGHLMIADYSNNVIRQVTFLPPTLTFPDTYQTLTSAVVSVTIANAGNSSLDLSNLAVAAPFLQIPSGQTDCSASSSLTSASACQVALVFKPTTVGAVTSALTLGSNNANYVASQTTVNLAGNGLPGAPSGTLGPTSLTFSIQTVGTTSASQVVTLTNTGNATLSGIHASVSGANPLDFLVSSTCSTALTAAASCAISVAFDPSMSGSRTATLNVFDTALTSPQLVPLHGTGGGGAFPVVSSNSLQFGPQVITTSSATQTVTITNLGITSLNIFSITLGGINTSDFTIFSTTCGSTLPASASCTLTLDFVPTVIGARAATVLVYHSASNLPQLITLSGVGTSAMNFVPVAPCRVADTRNAPGPFGGPFLSGNTTRTVYIQNSTCNIPVTATAYSLNVTVVPHGPLGFLTAWPASESQPISSTLNSSDGRVKANAAIISAGPIGAVSFYTSNDTDLVIDINGYFVDSTASTGLAFYALSPCRAADTRNATGSFGGLSLVGGQLRDFPMLQSGCAVPPSAQAYSLNFTAVPLGPLGFLSAWPTGQARPSASTLNAPSGVVTANAAILPAGSNGDINVYTSNNSNLVIDLNGYFAAPGTGGLHLYTVAPCRVLDTRITGAGQPFNGTLSVPLTGACNIPATAASVVLNATVVPAGALGFLTLWPAGSTRPSASTLNAIDGAVTSNLSIVPLGSGAINAFASNNTHLILDITGYFAP